jgi:sialic acid synthase SpsE
MTVWIAEVSSNHNGSLARIEQFLDTAVDIGAQGVKFQLFKIDKLFAPEAIKAKPELLARRAWELPVAFIPHISHMCRARNLLFGCTPFYMDAIAELEPYVDFFKVASYQVLWLDLLTKLRLSNKPMVLSVGMATPTEVSKAVWALGQQHLDLLHCVSGYPTPIKECNLKTIDYLRTQYRAARVGYSDHSVNPAVLYAATLQHDAHMVEFHLDIDGQGDEYQIGHCWLPGNIKAVIRDIQVAQLAGGNYGKFVQPSEAEDRSDPSDGLRPIMEIRSKL